MLDHLRAEDATERTVGLIAQPGKQVGLLRLQSLLAAARHRLLAKVDAARSDACVTHHLQKFSASAADIEHGVAALEPGQVELDVLLDVVFGPAKTLGETAVIELRLLRRRRGRDSRSRDWRRRRSQLPRALPHDPQLFV